MGWIQVAELIQINAHAGEEMPSWLMYDPDGIVYLIESDSAVRKSLRFALETKGVVVEEFPDATSLLTKSHFASRSCLVLADSLTDMNGLELVRRLRERGILVPAVLIASLPDHPTLTRRAESLKVSVVEKPIPGDSLINAIRAAIDQEKSG